MSFSEQLMAPAGLKAGADLSAKQYRLVIQSTTLREVTVPAAASDPPLGVLQNAPASGEPAAVCIVGVTKFVAGGAVTVGDKLMNDDTDDGAVVTWAAGVGNHACGIALETAADGEIFSGVVLPIGIGAT